MVTFLVSFPDHSEKNIEIYFEETVKEIWKEKNIIHKLQSIFETNFYNFTFISFIWFQFFNKTTQVFFGHFWGVKKFCTKYHWDAQNLSRLSTNCKASWRQTFIILHLRPLFGSSSSISERRCFWSFLRCFTLLKPLGSSTSSKTFLLRIVYKLRLYSTV